MQCAVKLTAVSLEMMSFSCIMEDKNSFIFLDENFSPEVIEILQQKLTFIVPTVSLVGELHLGKQNNAKQAVFVELKTPENKKKL